MEIISQVISFVKDNGQEILAGIGGLYLFLLMIVNLTPTPKDNEILGKVAGTVSKVLAFFKVKK